MGQVWAAATIWHGTGLDDTPFPPPPFPLAIFGQFELEHPHWRLRQWKYASRITTSSCSGHTFYSFCITFDSLKSHYWTLRCCWPYLHLQLLPLSAFQDVSIFHISFTRQTKHQKFCINDTNSAKIQCWNFQLQEELIASSEFSSWEGFLQLATHF